MRRWIPRSLLAVGLLGTAVAAVGGSPSDTAQAATDDDAPWTLPAPPDRCTRSEADSGDVADCLVAFYEDPAATGWGAPPAPGVGEGWTWVGHTYNGSPALAEWEATRIGANAERIGSLPAGHLETHVAAQVLFEGFLDEITAGGYRVSDAHGYSFRCTSGNGGWSCPSGDPADLSLHAWGLAIDMNAAANPIRSYASIDGVTACRTPIETDLPRWVIRTAEKWGLYWGGYGWNSGCPTLDTERSIVHRDPPHFEFRGTPEQALAIAAYNLRNDPDVRCVEVVDDDGTTSERCDRSDRPRAGWRLRVETDAPPDAVAALVNLTATEPDAAGFLTLEGCGPVEAERTTSAVNFGAGDTTAAMAVVPLDDAGTFCVYRSTSVHSIVDVVGFLTSSGDDRTWFEPTTPVRLTDTRVDGTCRGNECFDGPVSDRGVHQVRTDDAAPRIVNLTVTDGAGPGHASAGRCDVVEDAEFSNINYVADLARANLALVDNGEPGSCVSVYTATHVIVDQLGRLVTGEEAGLGWRIAEAHRVLDTRECSDDWCGAQPGAGEVIELDLGTDAAGVAVTLTVDQATGPGHAWIGDCDDLVEGEPQTSNVNYVPGSATANLAIAAPTDGVVCVYTYAAAHLIVDVRAELVDDHTIGLVPVTPSRAHDTRR